MKTSSISAQVSSDEEIINKILEGHAVWFELLIRRYNSTLYKIARGYGFNHADAEDLMQDTHFTAYTQLKNLEHAQAYKTWISKILINKCIYKLAHGYFKYEFPHVINERDSPIHQKDKKDTTEDIVANRELSLIIENCLQSIPLIYKSVFILREMEGFNVAETSELLGITSTNVKVRLNRAKQLLKKEIENYYSARDLFEFKEVYCDAVVSRVFERIGAISA